MSDSQELVRVHLHLSGRVQGVGFRNFTRRQATKLGLTGWVKNLDDGRVEAVIAGLRKDVDRVLEKLKSGPALARVDDIQLEEEEYNNQFEEFKVII